MMEESKELSHTDSPENSHDSKIVALENTGINTKQSEIIDTESNNYEDSAMGSSEDTNIILTKKLNTSNNEDHEPKKSNQENNSTFSDTTSLETQQSSLESNSNNKSLENHCADSNGPYEEIPDSQPKLEPSEYQKNQMNLQEKRRDDLLEENGDNTIPSKNGVCFFLSHSFCINKLYLVYCNIFHNSSIKLI